VSAYSFADLGLGPRDPTRMAAQVVSGIGFLGAGVIIFRKNAVRGLTTAASIWAVSGLGLASGGGLYAAAVLATAFILVIQVGLRPLERRVFVQHQQHRLELLCWPFSLSGAGSWHSCARIARKPPQKDYTASTASLMPMGRVVDPPRPN